MSLFDRDAALAFLDMRRPASGPRAGFVEGTQAGFRVTQMTETVLSETLLIGEAYDDYIDAIERQTGTRLPNPVTDLEAYRRMPELQLGRDDTLIRVDPQATYDLPSREAVFHSRLQALAQSGGITVESPESLRASAGILALREEAIAAGVAERTDTAGDVGFLTGSMGAAMADPPIAAATIVTLPIAAETTILRAMLLEGAVAGATEAALQPSIQAARARLGLEAGFAEGAQNVAFAALGGAAFGGGARGLAVGLRRLLDAHATARPNPSGTELAARTTLEAEAATMDRLAVMEGLDDPAVTADARARLAEVERVLSETGELPVASTEAPRVPGWEQLRNVPADDPRFFLNTPDGRVFLVNREGSPDLGMAPVFGDGDTIAGELPIRVGRGKLSKLDMAGRVAEFQAAGYDNGVDLVLDVLGNWTEVRTAEDGRLALVIRHEGALPTLIVHLQRSKGGDFYEVVSAQSRKPENVDWMRLLHTRSQRLGTGADTQFPLKTDPAGETPIGGDPSSAQLRNRLADIEPGEGGFNHRAVRDAVADGQRALQSLGIEGPARGQAGADGVAPRMASDIEAEARAIGDAGGFDDPDEQALIRGLEDEFMARLGDDPEAVVATVEFGPDGEPVMVERALGDLIDELEADRNFVAEFNACAGKTS